MTNFQLAMLLRLLLVIVISIMWAAEAAMETETKAEVATNTTTDTKTNTEADAEKDTDEDTDKDADKDTDKDTDNDIEPDTEAAAETESETGKTDDSYFPKWLIEASKEPYDEDTHIISSRKPRITGRVKGGTICLNTDECGRGKCCLRRSKSPRRRCRRLQRADERCTEEQMMGGYYYGFCPCNRNSVCKYVNGTQKCVERKKKTPQKPVPLPTGPTQTNVSQNEVQESQESEEIQATPKPPSRRPIFNLTGNHLNEIPEFFRNKMRLTPSPAPVPGTPLPGLTTGAVPASPVPTVPVTGEWPEISGGKPISGLPPGLTLTPFQEEEEEGLPGSKNVPELPPPPIIGPSPPSGDYETGLPGNGGVPPLPPTPELDKNTEQSLRRSSRSTPPSSDALLEEQSLIDVPIVASAVRNAPPFDFNAVDANQQRIL